VAKELVLRHSFSQSEAAKRLGTTQAAISQYLYSKRGEKRLKNLETLPPVRKAAAEVARQIAREELSPFEAMLRFCKLCTTLRDKNVVCELHKGSLNLPDRCNICL